MVDPKQQKTNRRIPGLKAKQPIIRDDFKISKAVNPFQQIWDASEASKSNPLQNLNPLQSEPGSKIEPPAIFEGGKGFLQIPNELLDTVFPDLDHAEVVIYLRLYRLSHGFGQSTCQVSIPMLAKRCKCSENTVRATLKKLANTGLIRIVTVTNTGANDGGTIYEVFTRLGEAYRNTPPAKFEPGSKSEPPAKFEPNKDHDHDDFKNTDHHQSETMRIYQELTNNKWKKSDDAAYQKIRNLSLGKIEEGIRLTKQRAISRPNSLNYFVKEILNLAQPSEQSKAQQKKALEKIVAKVREIHVGAANYGLADFVEDVKREAARESVAFDNDLFNQIIGM